jgi:uncharacterized membrane protein
MSALRARIAALGERLSGSLFFVPMLYTVAGIVIAQVALAVDRADRRGTISLPFGGGATVDNARAVLGTVAAATIGFAGVALSVSLLVVQMASSQYSPRVVHGLLRDPFSKRVMGIVVGTFTYCLVVLRAVRSDSRDDFDDVIVANLSVTVALVLGVVSILAVIAFINHSAHAMDVSELLQGVTDDAVEVVRTEWADDDRAPDDVARVADTDPPDRARLLRFEESGWIQRIDHGLLLAPLAPGATIRLQSSTGRYAVEGTPLASVWDHEMPAGDDTGGDGSGNGDAEAELYASIRAAVQIGQNRTGTQDVGYGIRQLVDVALRALSTGVNDPTTAQDAIFHLCAVLHELLVRRPPPAVEVDDEGRRLVLEHALDHRELIDLAFDQLRRAAASQPTVCIYLLEAMHLLCESNDEMPGDARAALVDQARLVVAGCEATDNIDADVDAVRAGFEKRFGT